MIADRVQRRSLVSDVTASVLAAVALGLAIVAVLGAAVLACVTIVPAVVAAADSPISATPFPFAEKMYDLQARNVSVVTTGAGLADIVAAGVMAAGIAAIALGILSWRKVLAKIALPLAVLTTVAVVFFGWVLNYLMKAVIKIPY